MRKLMKCTILIMAVTLLWGCADRTVKTTDTQTEETSTADIQRPEKVLAGTELGNESSLYDASGIFEKEGYQILDMHAYGDNGIFVLYSGLTDSELSLYSAANGTEIKNIKMEDVVFLEDTVLKVSQSNMVYVYDESNHIFCYFDMEQSKYNVIPIEFEAESMFVDNTGKIIYYTKKNDCKLYQYVIETAKSQVVCDMTGMADTVRVINIESKSSQIIVELRSGEKIHYSSIDLTSGLYEKLEETEGELYCVGEVYVTVPRSDEVYINVYNREKPRIIEKFYLEEAIELDSMRLFNGNPYLLTLVKAEGGTKLRFYSLSRGIMISEVVLPEQYTIKDATYLQMDQTLCIETVNKDSEKGIVFWDLEAVKK